VRSRLCCRGIVVQNEISWCSFGATTPGCREELRRKLEAVKGATMYVRPLGNDETYWWR
jgi:hypothetical protein